MDRTDDEALAEILFRLGFQTSDSISHFGVKGMKWGIRKKQETAGKDPRGDLVLEHKFKTGDRLSIYKAPPGLIARSLSRLSKNYAKGVQDFPQFNFYDKDGSRVGEGAFIKNKAKKELYLDWITVKAKHRGKGYASAAMKGVIKYAQNEGFKKLTLEVPGNAPDARHIYEKLGFRSNGKDTPSAGPYDPFDGLYGMDMKVPQKKVKHAQSSEDWEEEFANEFAQVLIDNFGGDDSVEHSDSFLEILAQAGITPSLAHFGIKGMKWGIRKKKPAPLSADARQKQAIKDKVKQFKVGSVTNKQLQEAFRRMQLEQDFKRLDVNEKGAFSRWISSAMLEIGKREVQAAAGKAVAKGIAKAAVTGGLG